MFHSIMEPHQQPPSSHQIPANGFPPRKRSFEQFSNWNPINTNDFSNNTPNLMNSPPSSVSHLHNNLSPNNNNANSNNGNPRFSHHFDHHKNRFRSNNFTPAPNTFHNNDAPHQPPRKKFIPNGVTPSPLTQLLPAQHQYFQQNHQLQHNNSQPQSQPQSFGSSQQPYLPHNNNSSHMNTPPTIPSPSTVTPPVSNLSSPTLIHNPSVVTNLTHNSNSSTSNNNPSNSIPNLNLPSPSPSISSPPGPVTLASLGHSVSLENLHKFNSDSSTLVKTISSSGPLGSIDHKSLFAKKLPVESKPNHNDLRRKHEEEYKMKQEKRKAEQMASSRLAHYATQDSHFWNFVIPTIPLFEDPNTNSPNSTSNSEMQT